MKSLSLTQVIIILLHAFAGWAFCSAIMGIGMSVTSVQTTLIAHAVGGPIGFIFLSIIYFRKFNYTGPISTAIIFISFVIFMDVFVVALLILKNTDMFKSVLGTWLPFTLIFVVTVFTGRVTRKG
jgi:hypothetical protein